jgi:hypothetical protein
MSKRLILYDRSRTTTDWTCPRKRYYAYEFEGKGIGSRKTSLELYLGTVTHDGLAAIAYEISDIDTIATEAYSSVYETLMDQQASEDEVESIQYAKEQATLVEGMLRGFYRHCWPRIQAEYPDIVAVEQEMIHEHDGLLFMAKPDLVVRAKEGGLVYVEYKTTSSKKDGWINSWDTAVQLHSSIRAIEETLHEKVTGVIVQGLYKGYESYGKQSSPFCYTYTRKGQPPFSKDETVYEYKAGFRRSPVWETPGGCKDWVAKMPEEILSNQFPRTPLIFIKDQMLEAFFAQRAVREQEISLAKQMLAACKDEPIALASILDVAFPQRFDQCVPAWGHPCGYRDICFGGVREPLEQGYVFREPHHSTEKDLWTNQESTSTFTLPSNETTRSSTSVSSGSSQ